MFPIVHEDVSPKDSKTLIFGGINRNELIDDSEWIDNVNVDTLNCPALSPRKPLRLIKSLSSVMGYLIYENSIFYVLKSSSGNSLYMEIADEEGKFTTKKIQDLDASFNPKKYQLMIFNRHLLIFPSCEAFKINYKGDKIHDMVLGLSDYKKFSKKSGNSSGIDNISYVCEYNNRIFAIDDEDNIKATALGRYDIWTKYTGVLTDSWATDVASPGKFTGINLYRDHITIMKRDVTYELYGTLPSNFSLQEAFKNGTINNDSIVEVGGRLYFVSASGVNVYGGGVPRAISYKLNEKFINSYCFTDGLRFYMSLDNGDRKRTYVYDTDLNIWSCYTNKYFVYSGDLMYGGKTHKVLVDDKGNVYEMNSGDEKIKWEAISKRYTDDTFQKKSMRKLKFSCHMDRGARLSFYVSFDDKPFNLVKAIRNDKDQAFIDVDVYIPLRRAKNVQVRIEGLGMSKVYGEREMFYRSEK